MVFEWMHGKPHSKREAVDVAASAVMMVCFVVLSLSAVWSDDPPRPLAIRICGAVGIVALLTRASELLPVRPTATGRTWSVVLSTSGTSTSNYATGK
jgi:hypothetical protein